MFPHQMFSMENGTQSQDAESRHRVTTQGSGEADWLTVTCHRTRLKYCLGFVRQRTRSLARCQRTGSYSQAMPRLV